MCPHIVSVMIGHMSLTINGVFVCRDRTVNDGSRIEHDVARAGRTQTEQEDRDDAPEGQTGTSQHYQTPPFGYVKVSKIMASVSVSRPIVSTRSQGQNFSRDFELKAKMSVSAGFETKILVSVSVSNLNHRHKINKYLDTRRPIESRNCIKSCRHRSFPKVAITRWRTARVIV